MIVMLLLRLCGFCRLRCVSSRKVPNKLSLFNKLFTIHMRFELGSLCRFRGVVARDMNKLGSLS